MTCENNMMASKKKLAKGMLLSLGVYMTISYDTFGSEILVEKPSIVDVLPPEIIYKVLGEDKNFKKLIDDINKEGVYRIEYPRCCCLRGNVCYASVYSKDGAYRYYVFSLIYKAIKVKDDHSVKLSADAGSLLAEIMVYQYIKDNDVVTKLNNAIENHE